MNVERSNMRISPNPTPAAGAKPLSTTDERPEDSAGGSFMALLANSIESSANTAQQAPATPSADAPEADRLHMPDAVSAPVPRHRTDGESSEAAAVVLPDLAAQPIGALSTPAGILVAAGAPPSGACVQPTGPSGKSGQAPLADMAWRPPAPQTAQDGEGAAPALLAAAIDPFATGVGGAASSAMGGYRALREAGSALSAKAVATRANDIRLETDALATTRLNAQPLPTPTPAGLEPGLWLALNHAAGKPGQQARTADRLASGALTDLAASGAAGPWVEGARSGGDATAVTYAPQAAAPAVAASVAEKVHYWITRGVQNAQLQLDAFGGGSVEVRILVQGNEAQVEFRSDQPDARKMLQDSMAHLKDMLKGGGLELAGGFVGSSAQQGGGARERPADAPHSRTSLVMPEARSPAAGATPARVPGRTVDIFV